MGHTRPVLSLFEERDLSLLSLPLSPLLVGEEVCLRLGAASAEGAERARAGAKVHLGRREFGGAHWQ